MIHLRFPWLGSIHKCIGGNNFIHVRIARFETVKYEIFKNRQNGSANAL